MSAPDPSSVEAPGLVRRLGVNTLAQTAGLGVGAVLGFLNFLVVARGLGPEAFGDLTAATIFLLFPVALADIGLATGVLREISAAPDRAEFVLGSSLPLRVVIGVVVLLAALLVSVALPFTDRAQTAIFISAIGSFFTIVMLALQPLFQARLQMHVPVGATLVGRASTLVLVLGAFAAGLGFTAVVIAYVAGSVVSCAVVVAVAARQVSLRPRIDPAYWRSLVRGSLAIGIATGLFLSYYRVDAVLVALLRDARETGLYGAAFKFVEIAEVLVAAVGISVFPSFVRLVATRDARLRIALQRTLDAVLAFGAPILVALLLVADDLILFTAGAEFAPAATALRLLVPYLALLFVNAILIRVAAALHVDVQVLLVASFVLVLNITLNVVLLPVYGYNVAAVTSALSELVVAVFLAIIVWRRLAFVPTLRYALPVGLAIAAMLASYWLLPLHDLVAVVVASAVYVIAVVALPGAARDVAVALAPAGWRRPA